MLKDYLRLAYQGARKRKLRSWLTMLGIFIGIAAVVALISLSQGLQKAVSDQFVQLGTDKIIVQGIGSGFGPPGSGVQNPLTKKDQDVIEQVNGIDLAVGRLIRPVKISFKDETKFAYAASFPEENDRISLVIEANNYQIGQGRLLDRGDKYKILVGSDFAGKFFGQSLSLRDRVIIEGKEFSIVGIFKKSGNPQQDSTLVIPESAFREIIGEKEAYDVIPAKVSAGEDLGLASERVKRELRKHRGVKEGKEDFTVQTPENILATLNTILLIIQGVLVGIAAISLLVGGIGIMNTMYTAVLERTKEIGIMKATGAKNKQIMVLFLMESGMLGMLGGLIGVALGFAIGKSVELAAFQFYESYLIRAAFSPFLLVGALLFAFIIGAISGILPARQAAKLTPVEALRK